MNNEAKMSRGDRSSVHYAKRQTIELSLRSICVLREMLCSSHPNNADNYVYYVQHASESVWMPNWRVCDGMIFKESAHLETWPTT